jgi:hypothetical protein
MQVALGTGDAQAAGAHRLEVRATGQKGDVRASRGEPTAEITTDPTRTDNSDPHHWRSYYHSYVNTGTSFQEQTAEIAKHAEEFFSAVLAFSAVVSYSYLSASIGSTRVARRAGR